MTDYTSISTGVWDDETIWNDGSSGFPETGDTAAIANTHEVTLDSAELCTTLTIDNGGTLTLAGFALTVSGITTLGGTMNCGASDISLGSGDTSASSSLVLLATGIFAGGSGNHIIGSIGANVAGCSVTLTSGETTINGQGPVDAPILLENGMTFDDGDGTIIFTFAGNQFLYDTHNTARTFYNVIVNKASGSLTFANGKGYTLTIDNDLTITAGEFDTSEAVSGTGRDVSIGGDFVNNGTLTLHGDLVITGSSSGTGNIAGEGADSDLTMGAGALFDIAVASGKSITLQGDAVCDGDITGDGTLDMTAGINTLKILTTKDFTIINTNLLFLEVDGSYDVYDLTGAAVSDDGLFRGILSGVFDGAVR